MRKITLTDIKPLAEYEAMRDAMRRHVIDIKKRRRVPVGDSVSLLFENRETVLYQIQEMVRAEHITSPEAIQDEIDTYNRSIPEDAELSATMLIELTDSDSIRAEMDRLVGINEHVRLRIGSEHVVPGVFEPGWSREDRVAAVQYVKFPLEPAQREAFRSSQEPVSIELDHPNYRAVAQLDQAVRQTLASDIA
jgi:hypothetical protein